MRRFIVRYLETLWYGDGGSWLTLLSAPVATIARARRALFLRGLRASHRVAVPVVIVGNIAVGGTGKTPFVVWLVQRLRANGYRPGVVCSGYRGRARDWPRSVTGNCDAAEVGDEAVLLARRCGCPVVAGPDRVAAARSLVGRTDCDVVVSDDGLQHYRLARDVEIAVLDGRRRHGNGRCLPAGPLREPVSRLDAVDFVVTKGRPRAGEYRLGLSGRTLRRASDDSVAIDPRELPSRDVHAVAAIGNPEPFFERLRELGLRVHPRAFPDHHPFSPRDIGFGDGWPVVMTEKDAVKCRAFASHRHWYLPVAAELDPALEPALLARLPRPGRRS